MAIVLGTIAHHNVLDSCRRTGYDTHLLSRALRMAPRKVMGFLPPNAFSVSELTGIPRETVRRKIASLTARGWIRCDQKGDLFLTSLPVKHFKDFDYHLVDDLPEMVDRISHRYKEPPLFNR